MSSISNDIPGRFMALFDGNRNAYGMGRGECAHEWWGDDRVAQHLYAHDQSMGVYPLVSSSPDEWFVVKWGCVDIDDGYEASLPVARNLQKAYKILGLHSWIERTRSKGYHVWLFASDWVPAVHMRAVQILACELIEFHAKEINPKQLTLAEGQVGNYVRTPYPYGWATQRRQCMIFQSSDDAVYTLEGFLDSAERLLISPAKLAEVAALYWVPEPKVLPLLSPPSEDLAEMTKKLSGLTYTIWRDGPKPHPETGHLDRSGCLQKLAHHCASDGLAASDALALVMDLDSRLDPPKYIGRTDAATQYERLIANAY